MLKPCRMSRCPRLIDGPRSLCAAHAAKFARQAERYDPDVARDRRVYRSARWRRLRLDVIASHPRCSDCGTAFATDVDHVVPMSDGGDPWDRSNLRPLCAPCHGRKTRRQA